MEARFLTTLGKRRPVRRGGSTKCRDCASRAANCLGKVPAESRLGTASYAIVNLLAVPSLDSAGTLPKQLAALLAQSRHFVLPPRRTGRSFPRVVKKRASKFPTKKMPVSS